MKTFYSGLVALSVVLFLLNPNAEASPPKRHHRVGAATKHKKHRSPSGHKTKHHKKRH